MSTSSLCLFVPYYLCHPLPLSLTACVSPPPHLVSSIPYHSSCSPTTLDQQSCVYAHARSPPATFPCSGSRFSLLPWSSSLTLPATSTAPPSLLIVHHSLLTPYPTPPSPPGVEGSVPRPCGMLDPNVPVTLFSSLSLLVTNTLLFCSEFENLN
jgi:hypothetical protein